MNVNRPESLERLVGQEQIQARILQLDLSGCCVGMHKIGSTTTDGKNVVLQVTGELTNKAGGMCSFQQMFVLMSPSPKSYYVQEDTFLFDEEGRRTEWDMMSSLVDTPATLLLAELVTPPAQPVPVVLKPGTSVVTSSQTEIAPATLDSPALSPEVKASPPDSSLSPLAKPFTPARLSAPAGLSPPAGLSAPAVSSESDATAVLTATSTPADPSASAVASSPARASAPAIQESPAKPSAPAELSSPAGSSAPAGPSPPAICGPPASPGVPIAMNSSERPADDYLAQVRVLEATSEPDPPGKSIGVDDILRAQSIDDNLRPVIDLLKVGHQPNHADICQYPEEARVLLA